MARGSRLEGAPAPRDFGRTWRTLPIWEFEGDNALMTRTTDCNGAKQVAMLSAREMRDVHNNLGVWPKLILRPFVITHKATQSGYRTAPVGCRGGSRYVEG